MFPFLAVLCVKRYVYQSWYVKPLSPVVKKPIGTPCKGWACGIKDVSVSEKYADVLRNYRNGTLSESLQDALKALAELEKSPANCIAAQLSLFSLGGFTRNKTRVLDLARNGIDHWLCKEVLAFHPDLEESIDSLRECAYAGSVTCMIVLAQKEHQTNVDESNKILQYLLTHMVTTWHKNHHGQLEFAKTIKSILLANQPNNTEWEKIAQMVVHEEHLPSILWASDAVMKGMTDIFSKEQIYDLLMKIVENGPWRSECTEIANLKGGGNRRSIIDYMARGGNEAAKAFLSFPFMYE